MFLALKAEEEEGNQSGVKVEVEGKRRGETEGLFFLDTPLGHQQEQRGGPLISFFEFSKLKS